MHHRPSHRPSHRRSLGALVASGALLAAGLTAGPALAAPSDLACQERNNNTYAKVLECVRPEGMLEHLEAFQDIADAHDGDRADQTPGYRASVDYVVEVLEEAGWSAAVVPFDYDDTEQGVVQEAPVPAEHEGGTVEGTGLGTLAGQVIPVDLNLTPPRDNTSGCEAEDFAGLDFTGPADIALVQRGTCPFADKVAGAEAAGAEAVVIMNQGDTPDRSGVLTNVTILPYETELPVVGVSTDAGIALAEPGSVAEVSVAAVTRTSYNVIGELRGRIRGNVVMAGAHLDSVAGGPGVNDNGSGSAGLLEVAQVLGNHRPFNTVRLAWWGAEELGLIGSTEWVADRSQEELDEIALYLNFDMIGSPNYVFQVYDANQSSFEAPVPVPPGSEAIETLFESFYTLSDEPYDDSAFSGRSDYQAFIANGIPSSGLFTGAEGVKTAQQEEIWGGTAGDWFDPCYHQSCDDIGNLSLHALDVNSDAVAFAIFSYAHSTEDVNGKKGIKVPGRFPIPPPAGPEHTFAGPLGGSTDHGAPVTS